MLYKNLKNLRSSLFITLLIILSCFIFTKCIDNTSKNDEEANKADDKFSQFVGSVTCAKCHKQIYDSFIPTGHFLTSQAVSENNIKGSFETGKNVFRYNPDLFISMEKRDSGYYQVENSGGIETQARRFDVIIGSGTRGQTYLWWQNNFLFQLPVSYLASADSWAKSPGDLNRIVFTRAINSKCFECHSTYVHTTPTSSYFKNQEEFDHREIIYGISCERCHGPAEKHVQYQTENPQATTGKYIINPRTFSRQQSLDLCAQCHAGNMKDIKPAFSFMPGDTLSNYFMKNNFANNGSIDVHGNQYGLLVKSKCFKISSNMTCITCHSPHNDARENIALYSQKCMTCHNQEHGTFCKINTEKNINLSANCIDCHMPKQISKSIVLKLQDSEKPVAQMLRTHFITTYADATKDFLSGKTFPNTLRTNSKTISNQ